MSLLLLSEEELPPRREAKNSREKPAVTAPDFLIKALNNDNHRAAEQLVNLFERHYGRNYPIQKVYDVNFWYSSDEEKPSNERLTSIVAMHNSRIIGHIAIRKETSGRIEFLYPALHPAYRKHTFQLCRLFWKCIRDLAKRQSWEVVSHFSLLTHPVWQLMAAKCFRSTEVALIPNRPPRKKVNPNKTKDRSSLLLMYNIFDGNRSGPKTLYPPSRHREIIEELYRPLGLIRDFSQGQSVGLASQLPRANSKSSSPEIRYKRGFGIYRVTIDPDNLCSTEALRNELKEFEERPDRKLLIQIPLDHPCAPVACEIVEARNYRFCGILPLADEHDYILYTQFDDDELNEISLYSPRAKALKEYIARGIQNKELSYH